MQVDMTLENEITVIRPVGPVSLVSASALKKLLSQIVREGGRYLVIDLAKVPFIDSSGLGALIGGLKAARLAGGDLRIAGANERARVLLNLTSLDRVLTLYTSAETAMADFKAAAR